jgi:hypothetical protein
MEPEMDGGDELGEPDMHGGDEEGMDDMGGDEFGADDEEGEIEDRVVDLEDALDELKAEFAKLMDEEPGEGDADFGDEEGMEMGDEEGDEMPEGFVREYVEKVGDTGQKTEGGEVGKGGTATIQKQNPLAKPNRMGGESFKLGQNGAKDPSGTTAQKGENNAYKKGQGELDLGKRNVNQPGGNKGAQNFYSKKEKASSAEGQTTDSKLSVNTKSVGGKIKR